MARSSIDDADIRPLVVYDGDCGICERFVPFAKNRLPQSAFDRIAFVAYQDVSDGRLLDLGLTRAGCRQAIQLIAGGNRSSGSTAINAVLMQAGGFYGLVARLLSASALTRAIEEFVYRQVARRRGLISQNLGLICAGCPRVTKARRRKFRQN